MPIERMGPKLTEKILRDIQHCDLSSLQALKEENPNLHWCSIFYKKTGDTALHIAAKLGHLKVIEYLVHEYTPQSIDVKNKDDKTPLHEATQFAQLESVLKLLSYGSDINALRRGDWTPLMLACTKSQPVTSLLIVRALVEKEANINTPNKDGWTCVHILARESGADIFDYLVSQGLNVYARTKNGRTALHVAALHGNMEVLTRLLDLEHLDVNSKDSCGNTPLHEALLGQHVNIAKHLVARGADTNSRTNSDLSILHLVASIDNCDDVLDYVLNELKHDINLQNRNGWTPLHCAARKGNQNAVNYLVNMGADSTIKDGLGRTPLDYC